MKTRSLRAWYVVHKWTSLVCTAFLLLLCVTGLPLIFYHEIDRALGYSVEAPERPPGIPRASLDRIVEAAREQKPGEALQFLWSDPDDPEAWFVSLGETADAEEPASLLMFDARTGETLHEYPLDQGLMHLVRTLHVELFAGLPGTLFLGAMGLAFVASLVSGAVVYGPFMRKLPFATVRHDLSLRTKWLDLHNLLGIVTLAWALVVGATGVINTLTVPLLAYWRATELAEMTAPYRSASPLKRFGSLERAARAALTAEPEMELDFVAFPGNPFAGPHHYAAFLRGKSPLTSRLLKAVLIDPRTAQVTDRRALPWYLTVLLISQPLHFGDYGGMPMKILWAVLDLIIILVLGSGLYLWLARGSVPVEKRLAELERSDGAACSGAR